MKHPATNARINIHIGRLVVDAAALGSLSREQLTAQLEAALTQRFANTPKLSGAGDLTNRIGNRTAQEVGRQVFEPGRRETSPHSKLGNAP